MKNITPAALSDHGLRTYVLEMLVSIWLMCGTATGEAGVHSVLLSQGISKIGSHPQKRARVVVVVRAVQEVFALFEADFLSLLREERLQAFQLQHAKKKRSRSCTWAQDAPTLNTLTR
jgi:hypothetical protein